MSKKASRGWLTPSLGRAVVVASIVLGLDQLTKWWAVEALESKSCTVDGACIDVLGPLRFHLSFNPGAAFSSFTGGGQVLGLVALGMSIYLLRLASQSTDHWMPWLFGAVVGGALGNLTDRLFRSDGGILNGAVVDFIDLQFWPIFNVADVGVVAGVILLGFRLWHIERRSSEFTVAADETEA